MDNLILRDIQTMPEFNALLELQQAIWGMSPGEAASPHTMKAIVHNGGVVIGAELDGRLVGFCFGFVAWRGENKILWSHMTGVLPSFRGQGIGFRLKHAQRRWALDHGYTVMSWTFDPMQRGNANFNFHRLGVVADIYHVNHYGEMADEINAGLASDRLEVRWLLDEERAIASAENRPLETLKTSFEGAAFVLRIDDENTLIRSPETAFEYSTCFIEIPYRINALKRSNLEKAHHWQLALRWAMQEAFRRGYVIVDFISQNERGWYVLTHDQPQV
jgi:predicted GNAT superfamily acetyltransferase